jgi:hypothetical protein
MLQQGSFRNRAAAACGIGESTFYRWLELSRPHTVGGRAARPRPQYVEFREAVEAAEASAEQFLVTTIRMAAYDVKPGADGGAVITVKDWRAAAYLLERKFRDRWSEDPQVDEGGRSTAPGAGGPTKKTVRFGGRWKEGGVFQPAPVRRGLGDGTPAGTNPPIDVSAERTPASLSQVVQPSAPASNNDAAVSDALKAKVRELTTPPNVAPPSTAIDI